MNDNVRENPDAQPEATAAGSPLLLRQLAALLEGERSSVPNLSNAAALLWMSLNRINWVGFYLVSGGELLLGPFQGKPACVHIQMGRGVCGTAAAQDRTQVVPDVRLFPGHIACDADSRSELVVPLRRAGRVVGVLDIDSPFPERFGAADAALMERAARIIEEACDWDGFER